MVLKRLCNLISRQARAAAASNKTAKIQISSGDEQLEPTLGCSLCFSAIESEVLVTIVTNKDRTRKSKILKVKKRKFQSILLLGRKVVISRCKNLEVALYKKSSFSLSIDQIRRKHLRKLSLMENFIFCVVSR